MDLSFNINKYIKVKLTELGYQFLADEHNFYVGQLRTAKFYKEKADKEGYTSFQFWDFIKTFGPVTGMGFKTYYETYVKFSDLDLEFIENKLNKRRNTK